MFGPRDVGDGAIINDLPTSAVLVDTAFLAISLYNVLELIPMIFTTFKRRRGLYFWSFLCATCGIVPHDIGSILNNYQIPAHWVLYSILVMVGWFLMVNGQSMVLFSRLHLIVSNTSILRLVLVVIIINAFIGGVSTAILFFGANSPGFAEKFAYPYLIVDRFRVTLFGVQEIFISCLYIYFATKILRTSATSRRHSGSGMLRHLIYVNVFVILLDLSILGLAYTGYCDIQSSDNGLLYSIKLKVEFSILNRLVEFARPKEDFIRTLENRDNNAICLTCSQPYPARKSESGGHELRYRAFACGGGPPVEFDSQNFQDLMKTTEVFIESESRGREAGGPAIGPPARFSNNAMPKISSRPEHSPSSSEINFASAGY